MLLFADEPQDMPIASDFEAFWRSYPHRVGRLNAQKAYTKARRMASPQIILAGVERYKRTKPEWQAWAYPASWLNAGRWMDEVEPARPAPSWTPCSHTPRCSSPQWCMVVRARERGEVV